MIRRQWNNKGVKGVKNGGIQITYIHNSNIDLLKNCLLFDFFLSEMSNIDIV